jgi:hypothetical protein
MVAYYEQMQSYQTDYDKDTIVKYIRDNFPLFKAIDKEQLLNIVTKF